MVFFFSYCEKERVQCLFDCKMYFMVELRIICIKGNALIIDFLLKRNIRKRQEIIPSSKVICKVRKKMTKEQMQVVKK